MPKNGNTAQKKAARTVQDALGIPYTEALRRVSNAKTPDTHWGQAADTVIAKTQQEGENL